MPRGTADIDAETCFSPGSCMLRLIALLAAGEERAPSGSFWGTGAPTHRGRWGGTAFPLGHSWLAARFAGRLTSCSYAIYTQYLSADGWSAAATANLSYTISLRNRRLIFRYRTTSAARTPAGITGSLLVRPGLWLARRGGVHDAW